MQALSLPLRSQTAGLESLPALQDEWARLRVRSFTLRYLHHILADSTVTLCDSVWLDEAGRIVRFTHDASTAQGPVTEITERSFTGDGQLLSEMRYLRYWQPATRRQPEILVTALQETRTWDYDVRGNVTRLRIEEKGTLGTAGEKRWTYDDSTGRLLHSVMTWRSDNTSNGRPNLRNELIYDEQGRIRLERKDFGMAMGALETCYRYDSLGRLFEKEDLFKDHARIQYDYDAAGHIIAESSSNDYDGYTDFRFYEYDSFGQLLRTVHKTPNFTHQTLWTYRIDGLPAGCRILDHQDDLIGGFEILYGFE